MKHKRVVTVSLIAAPLIAGITAYLVRSGDEAPVVRVELTAPAAIAGEQAPAMQESAATPVTPGPAISVHKSLAPQVAPANQQLPQSKSEQTEGPTFASESDSASFNSEEHLALADNSETLPDEGTANFSPTGRFSPPLMFTYPGGLGGGSGHHSNSGAAPSSNSDPIDSMPSSNAGAKNTPSKDSPANDTSPNETSNETSTQDSSGPPDDSSDDQQDDQQDSGPKFVDNSPPESHDSVPNNSNESEETQDEGSDDQPKNDDPIPPLAFNDEPKVEQPVQVPEPGTLGLLGLGLLGLAGRRKAKK
jgi:hypothetical protein